MSDHYVDGDHLREPVWIEIRHILMADWDPIGVKGWDCAADEYESYIPKIKALIRARAPVETLIDFLDWVASERMGFRSQPERARPAAEKLMALQNKLLPRE